MSRNLKVRLKLVRKRVLVH